MQNYKSLNEDKDLKAVRIDDFWPLTGAVSDLTYNPVAYPSWR